MKKITILIVCSIFLLPIVQGQAQTLAPDTEISGTYVFIEYIAKPTYGDDAVFKITSQDYTIYVALEYQSHDSDYCSSTPCWKLVGSASNLDPNKTKSFYVPTDDLVEGFTSNSKIQFTGVSVTFRALVKATSTTTSVLEEIPFKVEVNPSGARSGMAYTIVALSFTTTLLGIIYFYKRHQRKNRR